MAGVSARMVGVLQVLSSAVLWSTAGLFVRWAGLDTATLVAWRSLFALPVLAAIAWWQRTPRGTRRVRLGRMEWVAVALAIFSTVSYVVSLRLTSVANVMAVYATLPFLATGLAFFWIGERVTRRFVLAGGAALLALMVMAHAITTPRDLWGVAWGLAMTLGYAVQLVQAKRHPGLPQAWLMAIAAALSVPLAAPFAAPTLPAPHALIACALYGAVTTGLAYTLALAGARAIGSGEAGLLSLLDVVLGPFWVWLCFAERPAPVVLASGGVVLVAVIGYLLSERPRVPVALTPS